MTENYMPLAIEQKWQKIWQTKSIYSVSESLNKSYYCLSMLPYPSGELHMGHVRNYTIGDTISRLKKMHGYNVLQPIGWDAFGLPAENAAITNKVSPEAWTQKNIANMRQQFKDLGLAYDWHRELATCTPEYYRWNQWLFIKMHEMGLAYQKQAVVNWDPVDQTVLANEQVIDGKGWRSGAAVEKKTINQWFFKITDYADELLDELDNLDNWPEQVKTMQKNWIGRSVGHNISFDIAQQSATITVFTSRAETLYGVTFLAVAPEHEILKLSPEPKIQEYIKLCQAGSTAEAEIEKNLKIGFDIGLKAIHPATKKEIPIYVTNYVLINYGAGAVMGVPAHDQRDHDFAKSMNIKVIDVIDNEVLINSDEFTGTNIAEAKNAIGKKYGTKKTSYRLRDWGISRQRSWGTPIPIIYCKDCGVLTVKELPVLLSSTNATTCPNCNKSATRETDTMDTFVDSSWYYARYTCHDQQHSMLDERAKYWTPVDQYIGGIEHATMHLLYARFIHKVLRDLGLVNSDEPFSALLTQGMVLLGGSKMSKSKGNIVSPKAMMKRYGADTVRLFSMFAAPPEQALEWQEGGVEGAHRFLSKLWRFVISNKSSLIGITELPNSQKRYQLHQIIDQANKDYEKLQFNTVVSACMKIFKLFDTTDWPLTHECLKSLLVLIHPICPHISLELWQILQFEQDLISYGELVPDKALLKSANIELIVQVNGKTRGKISCSSEEVTANIIRICLAEPALAKYLSNKELKKTIHVPNKLINFVL